MTPSWGKYFMKKCLSTFDIPKESAAGVSGEAHSAYSDASALLSPQSRQEQERSDCSLGAEDRKKGLIFLEEAHECFQGGENSPTSALGLRKSWWSVWDTQELSLAPSRKNRRHLGWVSVWDGSRQLPWSAVTEGSLCLESGILGAQVEEVRTPQWKELFTAAWVSENELEWLTWAAQRGQGIRPMHIKFTSAQNSNCDDLM